MAGYSGGRTPICVDNPINPSHEMEKNKFIYVKRNPEHNNLKPTTVLVNPHFKENKTVYLNRNFQGPRAHINPNVLKSNAAISQSFVTNEIQRHFSRVKSEAAAPINKQTTEMIIPKINNVETINHSAPIISRTTTNNHYFQTKRVNSFCKINSSSDPFKKVSMHSNNGLNPAQKTLERTIPKPITHQNAVLTKKSSQGCNSLPHHGITEQNQRMIHTRMKIVNIPKIKEGNIPSSLKKPTSDVQSADKCISTRFKFVRKTVITQSPKSKQLETMKITPRNSRKRNSFDNSSVRKNSIFTRFKYIRNGAKLVKINKNPMKSKYKIVNNNETKSPQAKKTKVNSSPYRKRYVYLNKYNSSSFLANNVIFKNSKQRNLIKINGILYKNSPYLLKKATMPSKANLSPSGSKGKAPARQPVKCQGKYKIVRSQLASVAKLKKSNMACSIYKKTGKCIGQKRGTCIKIHNPNQIILCKRFLQGICRNNNCLLSHKVSSEKMPTCKYFLEGLCNKAECQYLHVKISPNADICRDFLEGFCKEGIKCDKRHQFLCPEYEKTKKCSKPKCEYPHGTSEVIKSKPERKKFRKSLPKKSLKKTAEQTSEESCQIRYYKENSDEAEESKTASKRTMEEEVVVPKRQKLGSLPSFIPIA